MVSEAENNVRGENEKCETIPEKEPFLDDATDPNHASDTPVGLNVQSLTREEQEAPDPSVVQRLKSDIIYRQKFLLTLAFITSFFTLGWIDGQFGPTFLDLQIIASVTLDKASAFFTLVSIGYLTGFLVMGFVFDRQTLDRRVLMFMSVFGLGAVVAIIPWCKSYETMLMIHLLKGICGGCSETCGNAGMILTWGREGDSFFQALHFAFALGGIMSPIMSSPYVSPETGNTESHGFNYTTSSSTEHKIPLSQTIMHTTMAFANVTSMNSTGDVDLTNVSQSLTSKIYIPYSISAFLCIVTSLPYLVFFLRSLKRNDRKEVSKSDGNDDNMSKRKRHSLQIIGLVNMVIYNAVYVAVEYTFPGYLTTFVVKYMDFSKALASYITSAHWASFATGRFIGIFLVRFFGPAKLIFIFNLSLTTSLFGILVTSLMRETFGIWLFVITGGFSMSIIFPTVFLWTEQNFIRVTGKIASLFMFAASVGCLVNPLLLGHLMGSYSMMWFCYLLSGETVLLVGLYLSGYFIARKLKRLASDPLQSKTEVSIN